MSFLRTVLDGFNRLLQVPAADLQPADLQQVRAALQKITVAVLLERTSTAIPALIPDISITDVLKDLEPDPVLLAEYLSACATRFSLSLVSDSKLFKAIDSAGLREFLTHLLHAESDMSPEELGIAYDQLTHPALKHKKGLYYTPPHITRRMVDLTFARTDDLPDSYTVLDPACGSGAFLLEALRWMLTDRPRSLNACLRIIEDQLFGVDRDANAVQLTKICIAQSIFNIYPSDRGDFPDFNQISFNLRCGNSLLAPQDLLLQPGDKLAQNEIDQLQLFDWNTAFPDRPNCDNKFDIIIGNPPYGLSRDTRLSNVENELLKVVYQNFRTGKINTYLAFMARSYQLLSDKGLLCFIVPNAWTGIRSGKKLRELWLNEESLIEIVSFPERVFIADPSVEPVIILLGKNRSHKSITVSSHNNANSSSQPPPVTISHSDIKLNLDNTIPLNWSERTGKLIRQIRAASSSLSEFPDYFQPRIALQAYARGKGTPPQTRSDVSNHIFHHRTLRDESCYPYLAGSDVKRFETNWSGTYLSYGKWLAEPQTLDRFQHPRIVIREIIGAPPKLAIAALVRKPALYNKSILHINAGPDASLSELFALLTLINSSLGSFIFSRQGRKSQRRLFPKLVNDDLKYFPIPGSFWQQIEALARVSRELSEATVSGQYTDAELDSLEAELNTTACSAYGLTPEQQRELESELVCRY